MENEYITMDIKDAKAQIEKIHANERVALVVEDIRDLYAKGFNFAFCMLCSSVSVYIVCKALVTLFTLGM